MSLTVALNNARSSLLSTAKQLSVSGLNIAGANDPSYSRKITVTTTDASGGVRVSSVTRATDLALFYRVLGSTASSAGQQAVLDGLTTLHNTVGDTDSTDSPAAKMSALASALGAYANAPSDQSLAQAALTAAKDVAGSIAAASATVDQVRSDADSGMAESVGQINDLLGQLASLNTQIVRGSTTGDDVTSAMDQRDAVLTKLSEQIGIRVVTRDNNDIAVYTDSGVPLFDKQPRSVTFQATGTMTDGATGNAVMVDGVPVTGADATMPISTGKLAGLATLRDTVAPAYQTQLDEMARGLVEAFAESDQVGGGGPDLAGLFTWSGGPTVPASGVAVAGIAGSLKVNAAVDPSQGGSLWRLRDGGINGADYVSNASGAASYSDRLGEFVDGLSAGRSFDPAAGLQSGQSLTSFATASVSWLENERASVTAAADYQNTLLSRASTALSNASGVNMDDEYATQLQLEQSYAASSKLVSVIDDLFKTLLNAVG